MKSILSLLLAAGIAFPAIPAAAAVGSWGQGTKAEVRLLAAGIGADGKLEAAIEIVLPSGWHTYWRTPGDAGIAPVFDFSASRNLGPVSVLFPTPQRYDDGTSVSNVYKDRVILPLTATVTDPGNPVELAVALDLGVCAEICIPDAATARVVLQPGEHDADAAADIAAARQRLPSVAEPGVLAVDNAVRDGGTDKRPVFRVTATVADPKNSEVFVEGPADWSPYRPVLEDNSAGKATWTVKFSRLGAKTPIEGASLRVTIVAGGRAIEQTVPLD